MLVAQSWADVGEGFIWPAAALGADLQSAAAELGVDVHLSPIDDDLL